MKQNAFRKTTNSSRDLVVDNLTINGTSSIPGYVDLNSAQTLTNKTISFQSNTMPFVASVNTAQTFSNKTISGTSFGNTISNIGNTSLLAGIDAAKISSGIVSNTEFDYIDGLTSNAQTQLNAKVDLTSAQTISGVKTITNYLNANITTGSIGVRDDNGSSTFRHNISYGSSHASFKITSADNASARTGLEVGFHPSDVRSNTFTTKFLFDYLSSSDSSKIAIEDIELLSMTSSKFNLTNVNYLNVGTASKAGKIQQDPSALTQVNNVYLPANADVSLKYLEGMTGSNIQTQLDGKVDLLSTQNIDGLKTFRSATNNANSLVLTNTIANNCTLEFSNQFSSNKVLIRKDNDDLSFIISNVQRAKLSTNDFNLTNGGAFQINGTPIKDVSETLTGKTIAYGSNTLTNVVSTNTSQNITANKNFSVNTLLIDNFALEKNNSASSDPATSNDNTQGYAVGSRWFNAATKSFWRCSDSATSAAVWQNLNRQDKTFSYFTTTNTSYDVIFYTMTGYNYYNSMDVIYYTDTGGTIELYNVSTASVIATGTLLSGGPASITVSLGGPLKYPKDYLFRLSAKSTSGGTVGVFCCSFE
jgi:hypothetical protein